MVVQQVDPDTLYRLPEPDSSIRQQAGEGQTHWSGKASIIAWLQNIDEIQGEINPETKVGDLIPDVKCNLDKSIPGIPNKCVFEIQTRESNSSILQKIEKYSRYGYTVFYIYPDTAANHRRRLAEKLEATMSEPPTLGRITGDGELIVGSGVAPGSLSQNPGMSPFKEFYIPTYERSVSCYDFGDFRIDSVCTALVAIDGYLYAMQKVNTDGQRTLPHPPDFSKSELYRQMMEGKITRESPIRGPR